MTQQNTYPAAWRLLALASIFSIGGCHQPADTPADTVGMLRAGSERACVAGDVQQTLRGLILPKATEVGGEASSADKQNAIDIVTIRFNATTLQAADKAVGKVSCTTTVRVQGSTGEVGEYRIKFDVSPAAESSGGFVVGSDTDVARSYATKLIQGILTHRDEQNAKASSAKPADEPLTADGIANGALNANDKRSIGYAEARAKLIAAGFSPAAIPRGDAGPCGAMGEKQICAMYPETIECIGMGPNSGSCRMAFVHRNGRFFVVEAYGWDTPKDMVFVKGTWANAADTKRIENIIDGKPEDGG